VNAQSEQTVFQPTSRVFRTSFFAISRILITSSCAWEFLCSRIFLRNDHNWASLVLPGADPARKFRGGDFSNIWQSSLSWQSGVFPNCKKIMVKKVTFIGFKGGAIAPIILLNYCISISETQTVTMKLTEKAAVNNVPSKVRNDAVPPDRLAVKSHFRELAKFFKVKNH